MTAPRYLICTDLDRTLLPNGPEPESPQARPLFARLASRPELALAYVTGRHLALLEQAIAEYRLPQPQFAITDVGTRIQTRTGGRWRKWRDWEAAIHSDLAGHDHEELRGLFADLPALSLQEAARQNRHKLSYYVSLQADRDELLNVMAARLRTLGVRASLVWSIDELAAIGLLDVLPESATKLHAVEFLRQRLGLEYGAVTFAGDSGNDLDVMASAIQSVLVANAAPLVRRSAQEMARAAGHADALYLARGGYLGMNGNYAAGILEGVVHFRPEFGPWIEGL
jgi:HAD superfamily hydrolase (TIGR01484 family)